MSEITQQTTHTRFSFSSLRSYKIFTWGLPILIIVIGLILYFLPRLSSQAAPENAPVPLSAGIEAQYGIRISQVAVTADGGMVDFRYVVTDPDKAASFALDATSTPLLVAQGSKVVVSETSPMSHKQALHAGTTYFLLYRNAGGSIKPQSYITVSLGKLKLERVPVR